MIKKTLVALALAATTVSSSAMAWTANGTGGNLELGGTLTPQENITPWEVMVWASVNNLNGPIKTGSKVVDIPAPSGIPVLGIRTVSNKTFPGGVGISPMIDFKGAINTSKFTNGVTTLTLDVKNDADTKIGVMTAPLTTAGIMSRSDQSAEYSLYGRDADEVFYGGLASSSGGVTQASSTAKSVLNSINPEIMANYTSQDKTDSDLPRNFVLNNAGSFRHSGAYGAGILAGNNIKLTLDTPAASDTIVWKASLPITVSYQ